MRRGGVEPKPPLFLARLVFLAPELVVSSIMVAGRALLRRFFADVHVTTFSADPLDLPILLENGAYFYLCEHLLVLLFVVSFGDANRP